MILGSSYKTAFCVRDSISIRFSLLEYRGTLIALSSVLIRLCRRCAGELIDLINRRFELL